MTKEKPIMCELCEIRFYRIILYDIYYCGICMHF